MGIEVIAISSTYKAHKTALGPEIKLVCVDHENHCLYTLNDDGSRNIIKRLKKSNKILPKRFIIE